VERANKMMDADLSIRYHETEDQPLSTVTSQSSPQGLFDVFSAYTVSNPLSDLQSRLSKGKFNIDLDYKSGIKEFKKSNFDKENPHIFEIYESDSQKLCLWDGDTPTGSGKLFGSLRFFYRTYREFDEETTRLAMMIAEQVALAIENSTLRKEVQLAAVSNERNRMACELHDSVTQTLFYTSLIAEVLPRLYEVNKPEAEKHMIEMRQLARGALAENCTLLMELRPNAIVDANPRELLKHLMDAYTGRTGISIDYPEKIDPGTSLSGEQKLVNYSVAQEA